MAELVFKDDKLNYRVYNSSYIRKYHSEILQNCQFAHAKFRHLFKGTEHDSTSSYFLYNIFCLTATSLHFYNIYKELNEVIKEYNDHKEEPLWLQSWMNFHKPYEVLKWHDHYWDFHGYISIDPKKTITEFREYEVVNEIGNIYIGPCYREHKVNVLEPYEGERITLGYDVSRMANRDDNISLIPIL